MIDILTKPKNALVRQYQKLFEMDGVKLRFTKGALQAVAMDAQKHKSGARGLRAILEQAMLDIMFEVPTAGAPIREVVINEETIQKGQQPILMYQKGAAALMEERNLTAENLAGAITEKLKDREKLVQIGQKAKALARPDSAKELAKLVFSIENPR